MLSLALAISLAAADPAGAVITKAPAPAPAAAKKPRAILVMDLQGNAVDAATLSTITNTLAVSVQKRPGLSVLTGQDVKRMAQVEADKQVLGCDAASASCIAEIAGAMGADLVLYGDVGKLTDTFIVNLNLFDAGQAKAVGRQSLTASKFDESFIGQLDITVRQLLSPVTGENTGVSLGAASGNTVPTIDLEALKQSGLKSINMKAEKALEVALDAQDDATATPERKRDAWCGLSHVDGANPYLEPATKACSDWQGYVVANADLEKNMSADYATLSGFLGLKRKSKEQKLDAIDAFLKSYDRLSTRPMVKTVHAARDRLVSTGSVSLDDGDNDGIPDDIDKCPSAPEDFDGFQDDDGCPDPDNDGDGIPDAADKCPNDKGVAEKDGCPETAGDIAAKATKATGEFIDGAVGILAFDTKDAFIGMGGNFDTTFQPVGGDPSLGFGFRFAYSLIEGGARLDFDLDPSDAVGTDNFLFFGLYAGIQLFQIPNGEFGLIRPSVGVDVLISPDEHGGGVVLGPYVANTFKLTQLAQLRVYYRYAAYRNGSFAAPQHLVGADIQFDIPTLFKD